jgi:hypothetical protein
MTKDKINVPDTRLNARTRRLFLNHLAETANAGWWVQARPVYGPIRLAKLRYGSVVTGAI